MHTHTEGFPMHNETRHAAPLLISGLFCLAQYAQAQPLCVLETDETDPFTKIRVLSISAPGSNGASSLRWRAVDGMLSLELTWAVLSNETIAVLERDPLLLMLENDSVITFTSVRSEVAVRRTDAQGAVHMAGTYEFQSPAPQAKLLTKYWVKRLRLYHSNGFLEFVADNDPLWQQGLEQLTTCFLKACTAPHTPANSVISQQNLQPEAIH